jgi:hypothetical protein
MAKSVFIPVSYRQYRQFIAGVTSCKIKGKGFETVIYDHAGDIQAIVHAPSIDAQGHCHPAEYYVRNRNTSQAVSLAA